MINKISKNVNIGYARYLKKKRMDRFIEPGETSRAELHSKKVARWKSSILRLILLLLVLFLALPLFLKNFQGFKINFEGNSDKKDDESTPTDLIPVMISPKFFGEDSNKRPYNITAKSSVSVSSEKIVLIDIGAEIELQDKSKVNLSSQQGDYFLNKKELTLSQGVKVVTGNGYNILTNSAYVNLDENLITGGERVDVTGAMGDITSQGFIITNSGDEIKFYGGVELNAIVNNKNNEVEK